MQSIIIIASTFVKSNYILPESFVFTRVKIVPSLFGALRDPTHHLNFNFYYFLKGTAIARIIC